MLEWCVDAHSLYRLLEQRFDGRMPEAASRACDDLALTAQHQAACRREAASMLSTWRAQGLAWYGRLAAP